MITTVVVGGGGGQGGDVNGDDGDDDGGDGGGDDDADGSAPTRFHNQQLPFRLCEDIQSRLPNQNRLGVDDCEMNTLRPPEVGNLDDTSCLLPCPFTKGGCVFCFPKESVCGFPLLYP